MNLTMRQNPVLIIVGGLGAVIHAALGLLLAFGVHLTQMQVGAVEGFAGAVIALVLAAAARSKVDSPATVADKVAVAVASSQTPVLTFSTASTPPTSGTNAGVAPSPLPSGETL